MGVTRLEARGVGFLIGGWPLVDAVDLTLAGGELVAVVGPNGAGKSTLCSMLVGDLRPTHGETLLDGRPIGAYKKKELARRRAVLPQQPVLAFGFTVRDVVRMGRHPHQRPGRPLQAADDEAVEVAMAATDVSHLADRSVTTLSGGEQTRVALARVLAQAAPVLVLDEPTAALDLRHQHQILATCRRLADAGVAVLAVLHDLALAAAWADRIGVMHRGRMVALGPPSDVLTGPLVAEVFEHPVVVVEHPDEGWPVVLAGRSNGTNGDVPAPLVSGLVS